MNTNKIYFLSTCSTCTRIIKEIRSVTSLEFELQDIKYKHISTSELDEIYAKVGSYESLFNKRAMKYRALNIKEFIKSDLDYRPWILKEYTFLKRPIIIIGDKYYVGNSKKLIESLLEVLNHKK